MYGIYQCFRLYTDVQLFHSLQNQAAIEVWRLICDCEVKVHDILEWLYDFERVTCYKVFLWMEEKVWPLRYKEYLP